LIDFKDIEPPKLFHKLAISELNRLVVALALCGRTDSFALIIFVFRIAFCASSECFDNPDRSTGEKIRRS
jgi:hypothetical protein